MKKYLMTLFMGFAFVLIGITCFYLETINYDVSSTLTSSFNMEQKILEYEIKDNQVFRITNFGTNKNMNLYIDNSLSNEVRIVINHSDMLDIESDYYTKNNNDKELVRIDLESELIMNWDHAKDLADLGIISLKNKTIYNYTLLKYPEIRVFVNENYRENIEFINNYGKVYNPIR